MSENDDSSEKEFEPTERKLEEQRRKGEVPRSADITTAAAYLGLLIAAVAAGRTMLTQLGDTGMVLLDQADTLSHLMREQARPLVGGLLASVGMATLPLIAIPFLTVWTALFAQRVVIFAPEKVRPKGSRVDPIANAKSKFGRNGLFEFAKSTVKLIVISTMLWIFLGQNLSMILKTMYLTPALASRELMRLVVQFLALVFVVNLIIGAIDFFWQRAEHLRKNRMSHQEMRDELKSSEGDPHTKGERRRRGREIATNRMLMDVADANVVIVNPTHYAVALKWTPLDPGAPVCVAKGMDDIAARIRDAAQAAGVPLHSDPATARALHATVEIGQEIRLEHFGPVAAAIRYAEAMRAKARKGRWA